MIRLGAFELFEPLGESGAGQVWRGRHRAQLVPAAIKVVKGEVDDETRHSFEREVQAHAGLSHPGVVYLFDYGTIDAQAVAASGGQLSERAPYLCMELADGGMLRDHLPLADWVSVRAIIRAVLDALAHAHARDVIHRDLKPENILVFEGDDGRLRPKLADFGIAHALGDEHSVPVEELSTFSGTPFYTAPEQARGLWRDYGPWTDLYALGCVVWELVCERPLFVGDNPYAILLRHIEADRPALTATMPVPPQLSEWLFRMLARDPKARFRRAADALAALPSAGEGEQSHSVRGDAANSAKQTLSGWQLSGEPTLQLDTLVAETVQLDTTVVDAVVPETTVSVNSLSLNEATQQQPLPRVPFPATWRYGEGPPLSDPLIGAGLGLFGLRAIPFVDRDQARDAIWQALGEVIDAQELRVVVLVGGPGAGKSSLAEWMATRADEVGVATRLQAIHTRSGGAAGLEGLSGMWRRAFRTFGLARGELYEHLCEQLLSGVDDDAIWKQRTRALTEWLEPSSHLESSDQVDGPRHIFSSLRERHVLACRLLRRLTGERPALVWIDDLQWGRDTLGMLEYLLETHEAAPQALAVATVRADIIAEDEELAERIEGLCAHPMCQRIDLEPLGEEHHRELISRTLRLEDRLLDQIAGRTEGNPLFATQLLRHLIDRDELEVSNEGFHLCEGAKEAVPADIFSLWTGRIDRLVASFSPRERRDARHGVELAAALGRQVSQAEWQEVCHRAVISPPEQLVGRMASRGLAYDTDEGFAFAHGLLVDSLAEQSRKAERWTRWHRLCAQMLEDCERESGESQAVRRGRHWMLAQEYERALDPLLAAGKLAHERGSYDSAIRSFAQHEQALDLLDAPPCDRRRIEGRLELAMVYLVFGDARAAEGLIADAEDCLEGLDEPHLRALAQLRRAQLFTFSGKVRASISELERALRLFEQLGDSRQVSCLCKLADRAYWGGDFQRALSLYEEAIAVAELHPLPLGFARTGMGATLQRLGRIEEAHHQIELARREFDEVDNLHGLGIVFNALGELARDAGHLGAAERHYRSALEIYEEIGSRERCTAAGNLGLVQFECSDFSNANEHFVYAVEQAQATQTRYVEYFAVCGILATCAARADWPSFDENLRVITEDLADVEQVDPDIAYLLTRSGEMAIRAGQSERARGVLALAREQWRTLGEEDQVRHAEQLLGMCE